jgi:hypothetical protein
MTFLLNQKPNHSIELTVNGLHRSTAAHIKTLD